MSVAPEGAEHLVSMDTAKRRIGTVWFVGSGIAFLIVVIQTLTGHYGSAVDQAWSWLLPTILPTLSLIIGVLVTDAVQRDHADSRINPFLVRCALGFSVVYLLLVLGTILVQPVVQNATPLTLMQRSHLFLGPFQGLVGSLLGAFFVKPGKAATGPADPASK